MTSLGVLSIGPKETVPDREIESEVRVVFCPFDGMVDAMHIGRDEEPASCGIDGRGERDVAMRKHRRDVEENLEDDNRPGPALQ